MARGRRGGARHHGYPMDARDLMDASVGARCTATSKRSGRQCGRAPIPGGTVCAMHGGKAPQVMLRARERLLALVHPAIDTLARGLGDEDINAAIRAARVVLDRVDDVFEDPLRPREKSLEDILSEVNQLARADGVVKE